MIGNIAITPEGPVPPDDPECIEFARHLWDGLEDGGVWGIPRSGLIFRKDELLGRFALVARIPWEDGMVVTEQELRDAQTRDYDGVRVMYGPLGIQVTDAAA